MNGIMVELILWTDNPNIDINKISQIIGIFPVEQESIDDIKYYGELKNLKRNIDVSSLMYSTDYIDTTEVDYALKKMINIIEPKLCKLYNVVNKYSLKAKLCVVINLPEVPIIEISSRFIQIMANLSAEIEFDTYIG